MSSSQIKNTVATLLVLRGTDRTLAISVKLVKFGKRRRVVSLRGFFRGLALNICYCCPNLKDGHLLTPPPNTHTQMHYVTWGV